MNIFKDNDDKILDPDPWSLTFDPLQVWDRAGRLQWEEHAASPLPALLIARHPFARIASAFRSFIVCDEGGDDGGGDGGGDGGDDGNDQNARLGHQEAPVSWACLRFRWFARIVVMMMMPTMRIAMMASPFRFSNIAV